MIICIRRSSDSTKIDCVTYQQHEKLDHANYVTFVRNPIVGVVRPSDGAENTIAKIARPFNSTGTENSITRVASHFDGAENMIAEVVRSSVGTELFK